MSRPSWTGAELLALLGAGACVDQFRAAYQLRHKQAKSMISQGITEQ
jgi:hypothetical protein